MCIGCLSLVLLLGEEALIIDIDGKLTEEDLDSLQKTLNQFNCLYVAPELVSGPHGGELE